MRNPPWTESEIRSTVKAYFKLLDAQVAGNATNKAEIYRRLAAKHPRRNPKAFQLKFQNISAILYEERLPYADGLLPRSNYQRLLKLLVLDYVGRSSRPRLTPRDILIQKVRQLNRRGWVKVTESGAGRFGLTLEKELGVPQNSSKTPDFMGIELKTKRGATPQTLFSRKPTAFTGVAGHEGLLEEYGYNDPKTGRRQLFTSFTSAGDSLGFSLDATADRIRVIHSEKELLYYDAEVLEEALLSKHTETAFVRVSARTGNAGPECRFEELLYAKWPSILRFLKLVRDGSVYLDFTLSITNGRIKNHGFLWKVASDQIAHLFLDVTRVDLKEVN